MPRLCLLLPLAYHAPLGVRLTKTAGEGATLSWRSSSSAPKLVALQGTAVEDETHRAPTPPLKRPLAPAQANSVAARRVPCHRVCREGRALCRFHRAAQVDLRGPRKARR